MREAIGFADSRQAALSKEESYSCKRYSDLYEISLPIPDAPLTAYREPMAKAAQSAFG